MKKQMSKSARIRKMLEQGKSVKQICSAVGCTAQLVYLTRSKMKAKARAQDKEWVVVTTSTSKEPIGIPKDVYLDHMPPLDYYQPKPSLFQRVKNWFMGV
jgi:transposase-like protein